MSKDPLKILQFKAQNIKRITVVQIKPDGELVKITGKNGQGKTSILDAVAMAFGGKGAIPPEPLRRGATEGEIEINCGAFIVRRTFSDDGKTTLHVRDAEGNAISGPQTFLDSLVGRIAFDPIAFAKMDPRVQADQLRKLAGLDLSELDRKRKQLYDQRTLVNRDFETARTKLRTLPAPESGLPDEELVLGDLLAERDRRNKAIAANEHRRDAFLQRQHDLNQVKGRIAQLEQELAGLRGKHDALKLALDQEAGAIAELQDPDVAEIDTQIRDSQGINAKVRNRRSYLTAESEMNKFKASSDQLTSSIEEVDAEKDRRIAAAKFPIAGLGFSEDGLVTFNGLPLEQASQAERLKVSMAIGLAANPTLRVVLIRDGNDLDEDNLKLVAQMAHDAGGQVWVERVSNAPGEEEGGIYIEDGMVRAVEPKAGRELQSA
jgi:energy-coupling factor transporter ATP-binding protein EcfA2